MTGCDRNWPETGLWGASFRVMFPLAALWAVLCIALWQWAAALWPNLALSRNWHIHEMTFGFAGAAVAGYLLTACSSWTGRAPVSGAPLMGLAAAWLAVRFGLLWPDAVPRWGVAAMSLAYFWGIAALLTHEAYRAGKGWRPVFIGFCLGAGVISALWIGGIVGIGAAVSTVLGFVLLLSLVSLRMVPAFLQNAASKQGQSFRTGANWTYPALIAVLLLSTGLHLAGYPQGAAIGYVAAGIGMLAEMLRWPLRPARGEALLAMLALGFLWLPIGLLMFGARLVNPGFSAAAAPHALMMGAMGGLIMAVSARAFARRGPEGLRALPGTFPAFVMIMASVPLRLMGQLDLAAALWCAGWLVYVALMLPRLRGPVPRPVFSGARSP